MDLVKIINPVELRDKMKVAIIEGELPALKVKALIDQLNDLLKDIEVKGQLDYEVDLQTEKKFEVFGIKYEKASRSTYKYDHNPVYADKKKELKEIESLMKSDSVVYDEDGIEIPKAIKSQTEFIKRSK
jgi:hypothetical protein